MTLSEKEEKLYNFIKEKGKVTIKDIETVLGPRAVGGIGTLIRNNKVEKFKEREGTGYSIKSVTYYRIKIEKE